jgi:hypothetical protein
MRKPRTKRNLIRAWNVWIEGVLEGTYIGQSRDDALTAYAKSCGYAHFGWITQLHGVKMGNTEVEFLRWQEV